MCSIFKVDYQLCADAKKLSGIFLFQLFSSFSPKVVFNSSFPKDEMILGYV